MNWPRDWPARSTLRTLYVAVGLLGGAISLASKQSQNFDVFVQASRDLLNHDDIFVRRAADYFKYSPTFALLFVPFLWVPPWVAAPLWSALNLAVAFFGIDRVLDDPREKRIALTVALVGIVLSMDGDQTNPLVAGAFLLGLHAYERGSARAGGFWTALGTFVKLFPVAGGVFALLCPGPRARNLAVLFGMAALAFLLPLVVLTPKELIMEYASWKQLLARDHAHSGWCIMHMLEDSLHLGLPSGAVQVAGALVAGAPVAAGIAFGSDARWRRDLACALLLFAVLFNHRTEYATFVLSAVAVGVWYATSPRMWWTTLLVALACLAPGPFFSRPEPGWSGVLGILAAHRLFHPLRMVPLTILWIVLSGRLLSSSFVRARVRGLRFLGSES